LNSGLLHEHKKKGEKKKMQIAKNKTATTIAISLILTITATLVALPLANARMSSEPIPTWTYVGITPETIGVNQETIIVFWCNLIPPTAVGAYGDRWTFYVDITKPDGANETLGPFTSDPVGGTYTTYTPTQVGAYTVVARMLEHTIDGGASRGMMNPVGPVSWPGMPSNRSMGDVFRASESEPVTLTVQQEPLQRYKETPLPDGYWTRPVYGANHEWGTIMGQWLNAGDTPGRVNAYTTGPESSHILWSSPYWAGGVMGGGGNVNFGSVGYYSGQSYEGFGGPSIILDGKVYYSVQTPPRYGWYCIDLYTGETIYYQNNTDGHSAMPSYGQVLDMEYVNQHGGFPYLWVTSGVTVPSGSTSTTTWEMLDGYSGKSICKIGNVSSGGTAAVDKIGSIVRYNIVNLGTSAAPKRYLQVWNTTQAIWWRNYAATSGNAYWTWRPEQLNRLYDGRNGFSLNVSIPDVQGSIRQVRVDQDIIGGTTGSNNGTTIVQGNLWALSLKPGEEGRLLWNKTFTPPAGLGDAALQSYQFSQHDIAFGGLDADAGIFWYSNTMLRIRYVYSLDTMQQLWASAPEDQWNFYGMSTSIYQGKMFGYGYSGILLAYNATTGNILWNWSAPFVGLEETPYTHTPLSMGCIADGKLYLYSSEHSPSQPLRRDGKIYCVDAETGKMLWAITCWPSSSPIIADGRIVVLDLFDDLIYCYGKGNSATTVTTSPKVSVHGNSVLVEGTVTDDTPSGRLNTDGDLDFTLKGTPAIADESMDAWMEYLYHQRPIPTDAKGVEVTLDAVDPNGNFVHIGTVTSDLTGAYGYAFTPEVPGTYQIIATFAGSKSYGSSFAQTYITVDEAPPATAPPEYPQPIDPTWTIVGVGIAIIIAVAIVGILLFRKRP
jgi:hypothetical protein